MNDQDVPRPGVAEPAPSEFDHPPETRWWTGWTSANPVLAQLFGQEPPGVRGRIVEVRVRRADEGVFAIQFAYLPDPPEA